MFGEGGAWLQGSRLAHLGFQLNCNEGLHRTHSSSVRDGTAHSSARIRLVRGTTCRQHSSGHVATLKLLPPKLKNLLQMAPSQIVSQYRKMPWFPSLGRPSLKNLGVSRSPTMAASRIPLQSDQRDNPQFTTTRWSIVVAAGKRSSPEAAEALEVLCQRYWYPVYAYIRALNFHEHDAQDLTQGFFCELLKKNYVGQAKKERGKFRSFLLKATRHFVSRQRDRERAQKRGGGQLPISLDFQSADQQYRLEPVATLTPERIYQRRWALTLLSDVLREVRDWYVSQGQLERFDRLKTYLEGKDGESYAAMAIKLGMTEDGVKKAVQRLRARYRKCLQELVLETVSDPKECEEELHDLLKAVAFQGK